MTVTFRPAFILPSWKRSQLDLDKSPNYDGCRWSRCAGWSIWQSVSASRAFIVNGSFVTDRWEPNDVDCVLLRGPTFPQDEAADAELWAGLPFIQMAVVGQKEFDLYVGTIFATDRHGAPKGMIEIIL